MFLIVASLLTTTCFAQDALELTGMLQGFMQTCTWVLDANGLNFDKTTGHWTGTATAMPTCAAAPAGRVAGDAFLRHLGGDPIKIDAPPITFTGLAAMDSSGERDAYGHP